MKKKKLKKMLALMLAAMTVSATPGLVGAMSEASKQKIQTLKDEIANKLLTFDQATQSLNKLEEIANEDDDAKVKVSETLGEMIDKGVFDSPGRVRRFDDPILSSEDLEKIIEILKICSKYDGAKENIAQAIEKMAMHDLLGMYRYNGKYVYYGSRYTLENDLCSSEQLDGIIDIFNTCLNSCTEKVKQHVLSAISIMSSKGVLGRKPSKQSNMLALSLDDDLSVRECNPNQISKILKILNDFSKGNEAYVASAISSMEERGLLNKYSMKNILDILKPCTKNTESSLSIARAINAASNNNLSNKISDNEVEDILNILQSCTKNNDAKEDVVETIENMVKRNLINGDLRYKVLDIFQLCTNAGEYELSKSFVNTTIIECVIAMNLINERSSDKFLNILRSCLNHKIDFAKIARIINNLLVSKNLLNQCSPDQIRKTVDSLVPGLENSAARGTVSDIIRYIFSNNLLDTYEPTQVQNTVDLLIPNLKDNNIKEAAITLLAAMAKSGALSQCTPDQAKQIVDSLNANLIADLQVENYNSITPTLNIMNACAKNESAQETIADSYLNIALRTTSMELDHKTPRENKYTRRNVLDVLTNDQFPSIISSLKECSKNPKAKQSVALAINSLAKAGKLDSLDYNKMVEVESALEECFKDHDDLTKREVFLALHQIMERFVKKKSEEKVVKAYCEYFKSFVENTGNQYDDKQIYIKQPNDKFVRMKDAMYEPIDNLYISNEKKTKWVKTNDESDFIDERGRNVKLSGEKYVKVVDVIYDKIETKSLKKQV